MLNEGKANTLNFIIKEHRVGIVYAGCQAESLLYLVDSENEKLGTI